MKSAPRAFGLSFLITLAAMLPLIAGVWLYTGMRHTATPAETAKSEVAVRYATEQNRLNLLVVVAGDEPAFVLLRLDAVEQEMFVSALPAQTVLLEVDGAAVSLGESYAAAGPARCCALLSGTLGIPVEQYLALTPQTLTQVAGEIGSARVNCTGLLDAEQQAALGFVQAVQELTPTRAHEILTSPLLGAEQRAALRTATWEAWLRQNLSLLPNALPDALRGVSAQLLTSWKAGDFYALEGTLEFLANGEPTTVARVLSGEADEDEKRYELAQESVAQAQGMFGVEEKIRDGKAD